MYLTPISLAGTLATLLSLSPSGPTESDRAAAAGAFERGQRAELAGDHAAAAEMYELAYGLVPSPEALRAAIKNLHAAGDAAHAATLSEQLLTEYPDDPASAQLASSMLEELAPNLTKVSIACDHPCNVTADGITVSADAETTHVFYVEPGSHKVVAAFFDHGDVPERIEASAGMDIALEFARPEAKPEADPDPSPEPPPPVVQPVVDEAPPSDAAPVGRKKLRPIWFGVATGTTAVLGGVTLWSGLDVFKKNRTYERDPTRETYDAGHAAETRTNILIGVTAALGVTSVALAVVTDWSRKSKKESREAEVRVGFGVLEGRF